MREGHHLGFHFIFPIIFNRPITLSVLLWFVLEIISLRSSLFLFAVILSMWLCELDCLGTDY